MLADAACRRRYCRYSYCCCVRMVAHVVSLERVVLLCGSSACLLVRTARGDVVDVCVRELCFVCVCVLSVGV
jgi:hypothetical protein